MTESTTVSVEVEEDDEEFDEFEGEDDGDPNPSIMVAGKSIPYSEINDGHLNDMTPEEYTDYFNVFQRLG